jgi:molybdopterin converting factor small subunit
MHVNVWIPPLLRGHTQGVEQLSAEGRTIATVLAAVGPAGVEVLRDLREGAAGPVPGIALFLNGSRVGTAGLEQTVRAGDEISIVPLIAGGT